MGSATRGSGDPGLAPQRLRGQSFFDATGAEESGGPSVGRCSRPRRDRRLGREYSLVTPYTSLMVLESLEQYVQYRIRRRDRCGRCATSISAESPPPAKGTFDANQALTECVSAWSSRVSWSRPIEWSRERSRKTPPERTARRRPNLRQPDRYSAPCSPRQTGQPILDQYVQHGKPCADDASDTLPLPSRCREERAGRAKRARCPCPSRSRSEPRRPAPQPDRLLLGDAHEGPTRATPDPNASCLAALLAAPADRWMGIYRATRAVRRRPHVLPRMRRLLPPPPEAGQGPPGPLQPGRVLRRQHAPLPVARPVPHAHGDVRGGDHDSEDRPFSRPGQPRGGPRVGTGLRGQGGATRRPHPPWTARRPGSVGDPSL